AAGLDPDQHLAGARLGDGDLLDTQVSLPPVHRGAHEHKHPFYPKVTPDSPPGAVRGRESDQRRAGTMRMLRLCLAAGAAALGLAATASAATYYVATTGSDTANGSSTAPWQTLQHAVETIAPGDVILVRSGTYAGCRIRNSGTASAPKTLARDVGAAVVIN